MPGAVAAVTDTARSRGAEAGRAAHRAAGEGASRQARGQSLVALLDEAGYAPRPVTADGRLTLGNCPYDALAREHRRLTCAMNLAWAEGVVSNLELGLRAELAPEAGSCCVVFRPSEPPSD